MFANPSTTTITPGVRRMPISRLGEPNPLPSFRLERFAMSAAQPDASLTTAEKEGYFEWGIHSILPYQTLDGYDRSQQEGEMPTIVLENDALRATLYPSLGGRLASLYDKQAGRELLFDNPVFQPANLAVLNAWFSGGIEWNGILPGHSPFTCSPVFAGIVASERGPILRLYEFERVREAVWQIDLFLPTNEARLWVHGRLLNPNPHPIRAYWWTTLALKLTPDVRVLCPADYVVEHGDNNSLLTLSFPYAHGYDGSYPGRYDYAASVFFRRHQAYEQAARPWLSAVYQDGVGLLHTSTRNLPGRKMWVFGHHAGGLRWMDFLSRRGEGYYLEPQAGIMPTQNQEFTLWAGQSIEWSECIAPFAMDAAAAHQPDWDAAVQAAARTAEQTVPEAEVESMDRWLRSKVDAPVVALFQHGKAWGSLHERLTGARIAPGLDFTAPLAEERAWAELVTEGAFSNQTLSESPRSWAVSPRWVQCLEEARQRSGPTWLHELHLGVARLNAGESEAARRHFHASNALHENAWAQRNLAIISESPALASEHYRQAWRLASQSVHLAVEICQFYQRAQLFDDLALFLQQLPPSMAEHERIRLARALVALQHQEYDLLRELLAGEFSTIREGETLLTELWFGLQRGQAEAALGRRLSEAEAQSVIDAHPMPYRIDFRMK